MIDASSLVDLKQRGKLPPEGDHLSKVHVSLIVSDVARSVVFYRHFFGVGPVKLKDGYAKFDVAEPALNFALNEGEVQPGGSLSHLGIQVESTDIVLAAKARLEAAGLLSRDEMDTTCCYALQDKIWVEDPDGHAWEIFHVKVGDVELVAGDSSACCPETAEAPAAAACCAG